VPLLVNVARRTPAELLLAVEAFFLLLVFRISLRLFPFRRILRAISSQRTEETSASNPISSPEILETVLRVRWAIESVSRNSPARFVCFPQSLAGHTMLRRRGIPSTIVYGVGHSHRGNLIAHTWLTIGDRTVVGGEGSEHFEPIERWT
jgi:hypothetical protein